MSKRCVKSEFLKVTKLNRFFLEYNVNGSEEKFYIVDMATKTCSYEKSDKVKYPCVNIVAAATFMTATTGRDGLWRITRQCMDYWVLLEEVRTPKLFLLDFEIKKGKRKQTRFS